MGRPAAVAPGRPCHNAGDMRCAAAFAALVLLAARPAAAETLEGWPCPGCFTEVPAAADGGARPLLVALHGDGGAAGRIFRAWKRACAATGVILVAPRCPREAGCTAGSWWQWYADGRHDPAWLGAQIDAVTARFAVDPGRIYATGYSGGATYLGAYVPQNPRRFAAVAHVGGGANYGVACPDCKVPVLFAIGAMDPMIGPYTGPLRAYYERCGGHEIVWETLPGVTHEGIVDVVQAGKGREILAWLLARPAACAVTAAVDAGMAMDASTVAPVPDPPAPLTAAGAGAPQLPVDRGGPPRVAPGAQGCACGQGGREPAGAGIGLWVLGVMALRRRRPGRAGIPRSRR